jgi:hypothetical protein
VSFRLQHAFVSLFAKDERRSQVLDAGSVTDTKVALEIRLVRCNIRYGFLYALLIARVLCGFQYHQHVVQVLGSNL